MCYLVMIQGPCKECTEWLPPTASNRGALCYSVKCPPAIPAICRGIQLGGLEESHLIPLPSPHSEERSSFPGLVPSYDTVNSKSVVRTKPGDYSVVIGYQVDEFSHTCLVENFVIHSHIYPCFCGKLSSLTHFPLEPGCEEYSFLDQAVTEFEQSLDSIFTASVKTPELDASFEQPNGVASSASSGFLCSVNTISNTSKPQLAPSIKSHELQH